MGSVAVFKTADELVEDQIFDNIESSDGKERSYFDFMRGVDMTSDNDAIFKRLVREGFISERKATAFRTGNRVTTLTYYRGNILKIREYRGE